MQILSSMDGNILANISEEFVIDFNRIVFYREQEAILSNMRNVILNTAVELVLRIMLLLPHATYFKA